MRSLLVFGFLLVTASLFGQFGIRNNITKQVRLPHMQIMQNVDLDGDGFDDILASSTGDESLFWVKNYGNGSFSTPLVIEKYQTYTTVQSIDMDGDGDIDILVSSGYNNSKIGWYGNEGQGNFSDMHLIANEVGEFLKVYAADIDIDGDLDILTGSKDNSISWYENIGNQEYSAKNIIANNIEGLFSIEIVDLDNDGRIDIVSGSEERGEVLWHRNVGEENFSNEILINNLQEKFKVFKTIDLDQDGDLDIIVSVEYGFKIGWYENNGNNEFNVYHDLPRETNSTSGERYYLDILNKQFHAIDINSDSLIDLMSDNGQVWLKNEGEGNFNILPTPLIQYTDNSRRFLFFDIDKDSDNDFIIHGNNALNWYENYGNLHYSPSKGIFVSMTGLRSVVTNDFDQDGNTDLLFGVESNLCLLFGDGTGYFPRRKFTKEYGIIRLLPFDVDVDEDLDIIATYSNSEKNEIVWYRNQGNGMYSDRIILIDSVPKPKQIFIEDLNSDGKFDVLLLSESGRSLILYENDGQNQFTNSTVVTSNENIQYAYVSDVELVDTDNDNDLDMILSMRDDHQIAIYKNDGSGGFIENQIIIENVFSPTKIEVEDIDSDGDVDIFSMNFIEHQTNFHENSGNQTYVTSPMTDRNSLDLPTEIMAIDLDKDNDKDLLMAGWGHTYLFWYCNKDGFDFTNREKIDYTFRITNVEVSDLNNDGYWDVIAVDNQYDEILWYENRFYKPTIEGFVFIDENENGIFDEHEYGMKNFLIVNEIGNTSMFSNQEGFYSLKTLNGNQIIKVIPDSCWRLTTDSPEYEVVVDGKETLQRNFGFVYDDLYQHTQTRINSTATHCGFDVPFWLSVQNDGCVPSKGKYGLVLDDLVTLLDSQIEPDEMRGDTLLWNYDQLFSTQNESIKLTFQIAGTEFLGDTIQMTGLSYVEDENGGLELSSTYDFTSEIRCAYDPNDKLVYPNRAGEYDKNYTIFEEELEYTVRFQNTGTDTAFTVVIKDYLDPNLNWKTFKPVISSHPHETLLHPDGLVEFTFKNILLPDSTTNEPLSHGFVTYKIAPNAGLEENTDIQNRADIYFDFNPPIVTNTTSNVFVSEFPKPVRTKDWKATAQNVKVYPNPFDHIISFELEEKMAATILLFDATGRLILTENFHAQTHQLNTGNLASGLHFYQILEEEGNVIGRGKVLKVK